jgi:nucleotide-binding universal stress UspA family protein
VPPVGAPGACGPVGGLPGAPLDGAAGRPPIYRHWTAGDREQIAEGYEVQEPLPAVVAGERCTWTARRLVLRSLAQARAGELALRTRLAQAQTALAALQTRRPGKPRWTELPAVREAADAILARYRVQGLLRLH